MSKNWAVVRRLAIRPVFLFTIITILFVMMTASVVTCVHIASGTPVQIGVVTWIFLLVLATLASAALSAITLSCFILYRRNGDYREIATHLHIINHTYRDSVSAIFGTELESDDSGGSDRNLDIERETLTIVCHAITAIFWALTGKLCSTSVFLRLDEQSDDAHHSVFLWAIGSLKSERDQSLFKEERIGSDSIFYHLDEKQNDHNILTPHILSNDFKIEQREIYKGTKIYGEDEWSQPGSVLIVPIRWKDGDGNSNCIGYLSVECSSRFRFLASSSAKSFNNSEHLQYLASFADQMFNFISLARMRGDT